MRIGIVSFAGTAVLAQAPTQNREDLIAAIDRLELQRHTAIGSAIIVALRDDLHLTLGSISSCSAFGAAVLCVRSGAVCP